MNLSEADAETYVSITPYAEWDGWDIVIFRPNSIGEMDAQGVYRHGQWGFERRISPNEEGKWVFE